MIFTGISKTFSLENEDQYNTIGAFWDELMKVYRLSDLRGLGYNWTADTIEYVIGLKDGIIDGANCTVKLPDEGWIECKGKTCDLQEISRKIYEDGRLKYEIETFTEDGNCEILYIRA